MSQTLINKINYTLHFITNYLRSKDFRKLNNIHIANSKTTIEKITRNKLSISRFGDGELKLLSGEDTGFQKADPQIVNKLRHILNTPTDGLLIGLPYVWKCFWGLKYRAFEYWSSYLNSHLKDQILPYVNNEIQYYDTNFTRFYIDYRSKRHADKLIPLLKQIWDGRDICFIEGEYSRLGIGNDLFNNASSIKRIICPATNAFDYYDQILTEASRLSQNTLILIALGMTATCLSYDLHNKGYQAIDIGHVDVEYEWYRMNAQDKIPLKTKYVAESNHPRPEVPLNDSVYLNQIIAKIGL